jgi:FAD/FMN-containing dehydrogenase
VTASAADWNALRGLLAGDVILPDSSDFEAVRKPPMTRFVSVRPEAIVLCETPADASAAVTFAGRACLRTAVRSGGHSVAGHSSTEGVVIDVTRMCSVSVDADVATVGAGTRLGALYDSLAAYGLTIPAGCGPSVGIAGLTLGGGLGILGRRHGLTCDQLLRAEVVLADGRVVDCDEHHDQELFWALRGAGGGNFGVVTSFVFRTLPAPAATIFHLTWPLAYAPALVEAWQAWAPSGPEELDATLRLTAAGDGERPPLAELVGAVLGSEADATELLDEVVARAGPDPASTLLRELPYREAKRYLDELGSGADRRDETLPGPPTQEASLHTKSEFFRRLLPSETIEALVENLHRGVAGGQSREVTFTPWGGAYNRRPADASAFVHRAELYLIQHLLTIDPDDPTTESHSGRDWLQRSWALVHPWGSGGVYPNFPDLDLEDWGHAYYGANYDRLLRVKAKYDPGNFFRFRQSLPIDGDRL